MDVFDQAQKNDELFRSAALEKHFKKRRAGSPNTPNNDHAKGICADCGEPIPKARLKFVPSATRCVTCQTLAENKGFGDE